MVYIGDALGSVRQTLDDAGGVLGSVQYDPWGVPTAGTPQPFGFTGELHSAGQVYLRARWYAPGQGRFVSEDPFRGWEQHPATLHPYLYVGNTPLTVTDPSGQCYPPLAWLRDVEPTNCQNLDMAIRIAQHPNASLHERVLANSYITAFVGSHAGLVVGAGILTWQAVAAGTGVVTAVSQWGAASLVRYPTGAAVTTGVAAAASVSDDTALVLGVLAGDAYSANEIHTAQQLAASDGLLPIGDVLAACA
jgi:RHS repeat-associated protein